MCDAIKWCHLGSASDTVPTPPGKSWIFFLKIPGHGKSLKITLVLEIKALGPGKDWKNILESHAFF